MQLFDGRPNGELLLATGAVERANPADFLLLEQGLVGADRMYSSKRQILESLGFGEFEGRGLHAGLVLWQGLVGADRVCSSKRQILGSLGFGELAGM